MTKDFDTYEEARIFAQAEANRMRHSHGIEKNNSGLCKPWVVKLLPRKEDRYGWERRCEAVEPENLKHLVNDLVLEPPQRAVPAKIEPVEQPSWMRNREPGCDCVPYEYAHNLSCPVHGTFSRRH